MVAEYCCSSKGTADLLNLKVLKKNMNQITWNAHCDVWMKIVTSGWCEWLENYERDSHNCGITFSANMVCGAWSSGVV